MEIFCITIACMVLGAIAVEDAKTMHISDIYSMMLLLTAVVAAIFCGTMPLTERFFGMFVVSIPMLLLTIARAGACGGGDILLCFAAGALIGTKAILMATAIAMVLAGAYAIIMLISKRLTMHDRFAMGPFLAFSIALMTVVVYT